MAFPVGEIQRPNQLSQGGGLVTVTNLLAKIGGQNHFKSSLSVAFPAFTANNLYMVYAVLAAPNTPALVISQNNNSVGPVGYTSWDLVGAFYANGLTVPTFGSFIDPNLPPSTGWIPFTGIVTATVAPTKGTISSELWLWRRDKEKIDLFWDTVYVTAGVAGTGNYFYNMPLNLFISSTNFGFSGNFVNFKCGNFTVSTTGTGTLIGSIEAIATNALGATSYNGNLLSATFAAYSNTAHNLSLEVSVPIDGFTNKPLKDL